MTDLPPTEVSLPPVQYRAAGLVGFGATAASLVAGYRVLSGTWLVIAIIVLPGLATLYLFWLTHGVVEVAADSHDVHVADGAREWKIPLKEVQQVKAWGFGKVRRATVRFRTTTGAVGSVAFLVSADDIFLPWTEPDGVGFLCDMVEVAGGTTGRVLKS